MRGKRILASMLSAALLAGMLPTAALAVEAGAPCENHLEHTIECGYEEGHACGHTGHTSDCYTDKLICPEQNDAPADANTPHEHTQECYELICPHETGSHDDTCGYIEARPCGHVCELCTPKDSEILPGDNDVKSTEGQVSAPLASPTADAISGDGYSFEAGVLTISSNDGTTNWKSDSNIDASNVESVVLESGVTSIGTDAFLECTSLTQVSLPDSLTSIGSFAFSKCVNLELTTLPTGVQTIGNGAFSGCKKLALTSLPENLTAINQYAFNGCESLSLTTLPDQIESIEMHAFDGCTSLALTSLPTSLKTISSAAFWECSSLTFTAFPTSLTSIGDYAFSKCTGLSALTFPQAKAPALGQKAFNNITTGLAIFVPYGATGYDEANWPTEKVVYGAALSNLEISSGTLTPSFFPGTEAYSALVENSVGSVTVTPTAHDSETITVDGKTVTSGNASGTISLTAGSSTSINVVVKNSDQDSRTYTINITRAAPDAVAVTGVTLDQNALTLYTNKSPGSAKLTATVQPDNATTKTVTWASSALDVVKVDSSGNVTAVAPGTATITATTLDGGKTAACTVTVEEESLPPVSVTGVTLDQTALTLYTNKSPSSAKLTATVQPDNATNKAVTWLSSAPGVATVDASGNVTAMAPGSATITVTTVEGSKTAACSVTVKTGGSSSGGGGGSSSISSSYMRRVLKDKNTGVMVAGDRIHEYAAMNVKAGALHKAGDMGCDLLRTAQTAGRVLYIYDVSLSRAFLGSVTVSIPVEGRDGQTLTIAHCINGKLALSDVKVKSGSAELQVKELSPFAVLNGVYTSDTLAAPVDLASGTSKPKRHRVQMGDTLWALARRYNCTIAELVSANAMIKDPDFIVAGWTLNIP